MNISFRTNILARALGATLLLSAALAAWGISVTLDDGTNTLTCTVSTGGSIRASGDIVTSVDTGCIPTGSGGGGGTGPFTLSVVRSGPNAGTGTVAGNGIDCGSTCSTSLASGTAVSLTATPGTGTFAGWSGGGCTGTGTCAFSISAATTVTAIFGPLNLTVTKAGTGAGTVTSGALINCDGATLTDCSESFNTVTLVTLTATPASGVTFAGWSGGGCSGTARTCAVNMNASQAVTATFNTAVACSTPPAAGRAVSIVDTGSITTNWKQLTFSPLPTTITAFHINVPSGFGRRDDIVAIKSTISARAPMMILSTQPGCADVFQGQAYCKISALDGAKVKMSGNLSDTIYYCKLPPGDYYINAFNQATVGGAYTCTNTSNCTFYASRSATY